MQENGDPDITLDLIKRIMGMAPKEQLKLLKQLNGGVLKKKRKDDRKRYLMAVDYAVNGHYFRDFIRDISQTGVFIKTSNPFPVGQEVLLSFMCPDNQKPFKITGEIVRSFPDGIGIKFKHSNESNRETIHSLIEKIKEL